MGYVAVTGGEQAIEASLGLLERARLASGRVLDVDLVLVDRAGHVVCLPRTTRIVWEEEVPSWDM